MGKYMKWIEALKKWNAEHSPNKWCIPKKGSPEHAAVRAMMGGKEVAMKKEMAEEEKAVKKASGSKEKIRAFLKKAIAKHRARKIESEKPREEGTKMATVKESAKQILHAAGIKEGKANKIRMTLEDILKVQEKLPYKILSSTKTTHIVRDKGMKTLYIWIGSDGTAEVDMNTPIQIELSPDNRVVEVPPSKLEAFLDDLEVSYRILTKPAKTTAKK